MRNEFPFLAQRIFNVPLAITEHKAEIILAALQARLGLGQIVRSDGAPAAFLLDDDDDLLDDEDPDFASGGRRMDAGYNLVGSVAVIEVRGTLVQKLGSLRPSSGMTGYNGIRQRLYAALDDPAVKAVAFDIDSPGGEVAGMLDLVDAIFEVRGEKPLAAILTENAFSAAYAIASAVDPGRLWVPRTGGTGSIGVICAHVDFSRALDTAGIKVTFVTRGALKAEGASELPLSAEALARLQADIDAMGEMFEDTVARNRGLAASKVRGLEAGTFLGAAGVAQGLADQVLAPDAAFRALLAGL